MLTEVNNQTNKMFKTIESIEILPRIYRFQSDLYNNFITNTYSLISDRTFKRIVTIYHNIIIYHYSGTFVVFK